MLSIFAMVRMGPWTLNRIEVLDARSDQCQRCQTKIKNVWIMERHGHRPQCQRIGSECGPQLEELSAELWGPATAPFKLSLRHLVSLRKIQTIELQSPSFLPSDYQRGWAAQQLELLARGLTPIERRRMGRAVSMMVKETKRKTHRNPKTNAEIV